ncbi:NUDIX hydrolase [Halocynthiibacter sp. SDUM655004]|uniref:NUDIX hydrolase n=1 Tax=Halocynthiibacter halioticoli TaxID=2986804 RepID=A0AAE3LS13_9RHOB|nr:NUDIX hydrolase [Halocynthiibacter sp. C4]MCV6825238.1 NUDIX hydrolase [Halocynthiibacter halioticoli]MCW4058239.1 NUDIX hydrolase [Halocynthiibacter sp. SDUM655004]MDE0588740.1 NUDIX hydrolase [Halocynthiibacter sp. C4]
MSPQPLYLPAEGKRGIRTQFGAICYRVVNARVQVLLVTTRRSGRWIVPKGWPMDGQTAGEAAAIEAWEEAGAKGKVKEFCVGVYSYTKDPDTKAALPCIVALYPIKVKKLAKEYPERKSRKRKWVSPKKAAKLVKEPELAAILKRFNPKIY